ncbi:DHS-like NAD/FAD-binding domain-containing protein [Exidia glandulosa HHB12029]|uniref:DHS-like NAD/FAD-binding domain-containing protein n=1 Tax=Exidia glandulosa HHB12029 TaxID=1314781 RepID=A0A165NB27_EXIGL|nr:DHS-like NAD/FAD-binding domain-containing protein [Exidia glandulosa HHB12029]
MSEPSNDLAAFALALQSSKHIIAITGAGLSAASGIPTFRGPNGLWRNFDVHTLATPAAWRDSPSRVWEFYHHRRVTALKASPNPAHDALARFSVASARRPDPVSFSLVTQNIDGLCNRALDSVLETERDLAIGLAEVTRPIEIHGNIFEVVCTASPCRNAIRDPAAVLVPAFAGREEELDHLKGSVEAEKSKDRFVAARSMLERQFQRRDAKNEGLEYEDKDAIPLEQLPRCQKCGALARPGVVWFGEEPRRMDEVFALVEQADMCLVIGTSSLVHPAAGFAHTVKKNGGKVAVFNVERSNRDDQADFLFLGPCEDILPGALGLS